MTKRPRVRCIFCLGYENISREHVVPDWVRQIIPKKPHHGQKFILTQSIQSNLPPRLRPRHQSARVRQGHPISRKVKAVCERCNTGWLSNLEDELKPQLRALILGEVLDLTPWDQRRLATSAADTVPESVMPEPKRPSPRPPHAGVGQPGSSLVTPDTTKAPPPAPCRSPWRPRTRPSRSRGRTAPTAPVLGKYQSCFGPIA